MCLSVVESIEINQTHCLNLNCNVFVNASCTWSVIRESFKQESQQKFKVKFQRIWNHLCLMRKRPSICDMKRVTWLWYETYNMFFVCEKRYAHSNHLHLEINFRSGRSVKSTSSVREKNALSVHWNHEVIIQQKVCAVMYFKFNVWSCVSILFQTQSVRDCFR